MTTCEVRNENAKIYICIEGTAERVSNQSVIKADSVSAAKCFRVLFRSLHAVMSSQFRSFTSDADPNTRLARLARNGLTGNPPNGGPKLCYTFER